MTTASFLQRCEDYRARRGISRSYLSRLLFDDGKVIDDLSEGGNMTLRRLARADVLLGEFERALARNCAQGGSTDRAA